MVGWHHRLHGHEFERTPGVGDGQGGLACCSPWGRKESDTTDNEDLVTEHSKVYGILQETLDDGDDVVKWKEDRLWRKANLFASCSLIEVYTWSGETGRFCMGFGVYVGQRECSKHFTSFPFSEES